MNWWPIMTPWMLDILDSDNSNPKKNNPNNNIDSLRNQVNDIIEWTWFENINCWDPEVSGD